MCHAPLFGFTGEVLHTLHSIEAGISTLAPGGM